MENKKRLHSDITGKMLKAFYQVYNGLGYGFPKKVYINALVHELRKTGLTCEQNKSVEIYYDAIDVGDFTANIVVNSVVLLEIGIHDEIKAEEGEILFHRLRSSIFEVGLLLNFGHSPEHMRKVYTNDRKTNIS